MLMILTVFLLLTVGYLFMIMPRMTNRPDVTPLKGFYYAHRGLHDNNGDAPENSMAAFQKAVDANYGIELDIQLTKDGIPVVFHDETLKRVCGIGEKLRDYTYEELQQFTLCNSKERIPKLEEVLNLVNGTVPLIIEIKHYANSHMLCQIADKRIKQYHGVYCIESFHPLIVRWYRKYRPEVIRGQLSSNFNKKSKKESLAEALVHYLLVNILCKPDFISYDHKYKNNLSRVLCKTLYHPLNVAWTIRSQNELDDCRDDFELFIFEKFEPED